MHTLMPLPYDYNALEPFIDAKTVEIHYSKHHQTYINKLNEALKGYPELLELSLVDLLKGLNNLPANLKPSVLNNGGQTYNHNIYWESMTAKGGGTPAGQLGDKIKEDFGSFEIFMEHFNSAGTAQFGSGWVWLSLESGKLCIDKTSNADTPLLHGKIPLMTMDVWEHAYYLNYQNRRPDYIAAFWNLINWPEIEKKYLSALS